MGNPFIHPGDFTRYVWNELDKIVNSEGKEKRSENEEFPQSISYVFVSLAEF